MGEGSILQNTPRVSHGLSSDRTCLHLIPHYGSFQDWFKIISLATYNATDAEVELALAPTVNVIIDLENEELHKDENILDEISSSDDKKTLATGDTSLLTKWALREKIAV